MSCPGLERSASVTGVEPLALIQARRTVFGVKAQAVTRCGRHEGNCEAASECETCLGAATSPIRPNRVHANLNGDHNPARSPSR